MDFTFVCWRTIKKPFQHIKTESSNILHYVELVKIALMTVQTVGMTDAIRSPLIEAKQMEIQHEQK